MSMSSWARFYERHSKAHYTPVFNTFLDAQIADVNLDLLVRVLAWVLRNSRGRHSDGVIDAEGMRQSLTGIPKSTVAYSITRLNDLRLIFTQTGNSGRRTVHRLLSHAPLRSEPVQAKAVKA